MRAVCRFCWLIALVGCAASDAETGRGGGPGADVGAGAAGGAASDDDFGNADPGAGPALPGDPVAAPGGDGDEEVCGSVSIDAEVEIIEEPGNLLVIFDRSNSMLGTIDTPSGPQARYLAAGEALINAVTPIADLLTVGAILYPSVGGQLQFCTAYVDPITSPENIDFLPGPQFIDAWNGYWTTHTLLFGTWINQAFERADEALSSTPLTGPTAVVLLSDGEPVCQDGTPADQMAAQWQAQGISTYVVGLPGALGSPYLTGVATQGGTGNYVTPANSSELQKQFETIVRSTIRSGIDSCSIALTPPPEDPALVHLVVDEQGSGMQFEVPRELAGGGWSISADGSEVTLQGALCDDALTGRFSSVTFEFGCVELPILLE